MSKIPAPAFRGTVPEDGKLHIINGKKFAQYIATLHGDVLVRVEKPKRKRSDAQNRWYWGVVLQLMEEETGHTKEELHEAMKMRFNKRLITLGGNVMTIPGTTTKMKTSEFSEFVEKVRHFAVTYLNLTIPDPDPNYAI